MMRFRSGGGLLLGVFLAACSYGQALKSETVANPSSAGSVQGNWSLTADGKPLFSWVEAADDESATLRYAIRNGAQWSQPRTIAAKRQFFRHPAEAPGVTALKDGSLVAYWVEMPPDSEAEIVHISASKDGVRWTTPVIAHKDRSQNLHGLASMAASGDQEVSLIWLEALKGEDEPSVLKRTVVNAAGAVVKEENLDTDVCTCCPTSVARTAKGLLVAYRGHNAQDIRDITVKRFEAGKWTPAKVISPDNWKINACPTNAASAAAKGDRVAVAWYTGAGNQYKTQLAFSTDGGATFGKPVLVSTGHSFGYTSVALDDEGGAVISWLEQGKEATGLLARYVTAAGVAGPVLQVAQGGKQGLGYARLLQVGKETWIAWGNSDGAKVQTARLTK